MPPVGQHVNWRASVTSTVRMTQSFNSSMITPWQGVTKSGFVFVHSCFKGLQHRTFQTFSNIKYTTFHPNLRIFLGSFNPPLSRRKRAAARRAAKEGGGKEEKEAEIAEADGRPKKR